VVSLCLSRDWRATRGRVRDIVGKEWLRPLRALREDLLTFEYGPVLEGTGPCRIFWDAHGFDVAECVLGEILPRVAARDHLVVMHDLADARYAPPEKALYGHGLWKGGNLGLGPSLRLGHIDSAVEQSVSILDFTSRNEILLNSADHSFHTELGSDQTKVSEMKAAIGEELFSLSAHWFWFTLNGGPGEYTFPRFRRPNAFHQWARRMRARTAARCRHLCGMCR